MIQLYGSILCPYTQRVRALLLDLGIEFENREVDLGDRDPEFLVLTPTGRVPLLIDGKIKLWESAVIADYLAETHGFEHAYDADAATRARERLAMTSWDRHVLPIHARALRDPTSFDADAHKRLDAHMTEFERTLRRTGERVGNLLSYHCAPFWVRMDWMRDHSPVPEAIAAHADARAWLDASAAMDAIRRTLPDRELAVRRGLEQLADEPEWTR